MNGTDFMVDGGMTKVVSFNAYRCVLCFADDYRHIQPLKGRQQRRQRIIHASKDGSDFTTPYIL